MKRLPLFDSKNFVIVHPELAEAAGVNAAAIIQKVHFFLENPQSGRTHNGRRWLWGSAQEWRDEYFSWLSLSQFRAIRDELVRAGILLKTDELSREEFKARDRNKLNQAWLTLDADCLQKGLDLWHAAGKPKNALCDILKSHAENQQDSSAAENQQDNGPSHAENQQDFEGGLGGDLTDLTNGKDRIYYKDQDKKEPPAASPMKITFNRVFMLLDGITPDLRQQWLKAYPQVDLDQAIAGTVAWCARKGFEGGREVGDMITTFLQRAQERNKDKLTLAVDNDKPKKEKPITEEDLSFESEEERADLLEQYRMPRTGSDERGPKGIMSTMTFRWDQHKSFAEFVCDFRAGLIPRKNKRKPVQMPAHLRKSVSAE